jgi:hypothetical protein
VTASDGNPPTHLGHSPPLGRIGICKTRHCPSDKVHWQCKDDPGVDLEGVRGRALGEPRCDMSIMSSRSERQSSRFTVRGR